MGGVDIARVDFFSSPVSERPSAVTSGQAAAAAYLESPSTGTQNSNQHSLTPGYYKYHLFHIICVRLEHTSWYVVRNSSHSQIVKFIIS